MDVLSVVSGRLRSAREELLSLPNSSELLLPPRGRLPQPTGELSCTLQNTLFRIMASSSPAKRSYLQHPRSPTHIRLMRRCPERERGKDSGPLGGSWVVISRVISRATILIIHIQGLLTLLITTPEEPPSRPQTLDPYRIPIDPFKGALKGTLITYLLIL